MLSYKLANKFVMPLWKYIQIPKQGHGGKHAEKYFKQFTIQCFYKRRKGESRNIASSNDCGLTKTKETYPLQF